MITIYSGYEINERINKWDGWVYYYTNGFVQYLKDNGIEVSLKISNRYKDIKSHFIIELNNKYWVVDPYDQKSLEHTRCGEFINDNDCVGIFKSQYKNSLNLCNKVIPWIYTPFNPSLCFEFKKKIDKKDWDNKKLYWRGTTRHGRFKILDKLKDILNDNLNKIDMLRYFDEIRNSRIILSLRGAASFNHREFEAFSIGTPVIMKIPDVITYNQLIPNYHYVATNTDNPEEIRNRYYEVIDDKEYLKFIADNAQKWVTDNIEPPMCFDLMKNIIGL